MQNDLQIESGITPVLAQLVGAVEYTNYIYAEKEDSSNECLDMTQNNLMAKLQ